MLFWIPFTLLVSLLAMAAINGWFWFGLALILEGVVLAVAGYWLNTNTPVQQPLPVVGGVMILAGLIVLAIV